MDITNIIIIIALVFIMVLSALRIIKLLINRGKLKKFYRSRTIDRDSSNDRFL